MLLWLIGAAFGGVIFAEEELQEHCVGSGECPMVLGEVISAECRSVGTDTFGVIHTRYGASIEVLTPSAEMDLGSVFSLHTLNSDYSEADEAPGCVDTDPGHPVGEIARYYLQPEPVDGIYSLYDIETFYPNPESDPDPEPICDLDAGPDTDEPLPEPSDSDGDGASTEPEKKGCAHVQASPIGTLWLGGLFGLACRFRPKHTHTHGRTKAPGPR
jgi:hypothetical protein